MGKYKISDTAILTDSGGERALVVNKLEYLSNLNIKNTIKDLSPDYFNNRIHSFGGTVSGYVCGGLPAPNHGNVIEKFPFATDTNASDVGDLSLASIAQGGNSSATHAHVSGGDNPSNPFPNDIDVIQTFPFANENNCIAASNLRVQREYHVGQSSSTHGYLSGGFTPSPYSDYTKIEKFPFASVGFGTSAIGDLTERRFRPAGHSSSSNGYISGGQEPPTAPVTDKIEKFSFAVDANGVDVGNLSVARYYTSGQSSSTHGYTSGGVTPATNNSDVIDKFSFSTDGNATDIGNLVEGKYSFTTQSSITNGYTAGGFTGPPYIAKNIIDKFPFSSDTNASDVGDLTAAKYRGVGLED